MNVRLVVAVASILLAGCAASVKYAPRVPGFQPGYVEQRLGDDTYQVRIGEAWPKDWPDLEKFAMYRAAEITQLRGLPYFQVINASSQVSNYEIKSPAISTTTGTASRVGNTTFVNATTTTTPASTSTISGGWYTLDFRVVAEAGSGASAPVVDAQQVIRDLRYFIDSRR
jgi:hypothetical protein